MTSKKCIDAEKLIQYKNSELPENELNALKAHLSTCELCRRNLQMSDNIDKILFGKGKAIKNYIQNLKKRRTCLSENLLYNYIEGNVTKTKARKIENHLNSCDNCLSEFASLVRNSLTPLAKNEKTSIQKLRTLSVEEQADKIISYQEEINQPVVETSVERSVSRAANFFEKIKKLNSRLFIGESWGRPAFATLILLVCVFGGYKGIQYYNTGYQVRLAENKLLNNYQIFVENARLSGGYKSSGISFLLSSDEEENKAYLEQSKINLNKAINNNSESIKASQLLAHIFLIENKLSSADSVFAQMEETNMSAEILNDMGVLFFQQQEWENALIKFQLALKKNPGLLEARYNLALCKKEIGAMAEAVSILKKYVTLETDEEWKNAAQHLISNISLVEEKME
ncbi:hypothetical protein H8E88_24310 [candidate division KSB1 bacterium]|nr:hypothetical protein [candidate division KSB1 bacterium]MBL7095338.1 hypothetical protein [candidate division KSB1 bacterium]